MSVLESSLAEVRQNRRLQFGLVAIATIVALYLLLLWGDAIDRSERTLARVNDDLRLAGSSDAVEQRWSETAQRAAKMVTTLESQLWKAPTLAQAQAQIQDWASGALAGAGARGATVAVGADAGGAERRDPTGLTPVRLMISFDAAPQVLDQVLPVLEGSQRLTRITTLRAARGQQRTEIVLLAYARITAAETQAAAVPGQR